MGRLVEVLGKPRKLSANAKRLVAQMAEAIRTKGGARKKGASQEKAHAARNALAVSLAMQGIKNMYEQGKCVVKQHHIIAFLEGEKLHKVPSTIQSYLTYIRSLQTSIGREWVTGHNKVYARVVDHKREVTEYSATRTEADRKQPKRIDQAQFAAAVEIIRGKCPSTFHAVRLDRFVGMRPAEARMWRGEELFQRDGKYYLEDLNGKAREVSVKQLERRYTSAISRHLMQTVNKEQDGMRFVVVYDGAKNNNPRLCKVFLQSQRDALDGAKRYMRETGRQSLYDPEKYKTKEQVQSRFGNVARAAGMTQENNCNPHLGRHELAWELYNKHGWSFERITLYLGHYSADKVLHYVKL